MVAITGKQITRFFRGRATLRFAAHKGRSERFVQQQVESELTEEVLDSKPRNGRVYPVLFFGSLDYAWITPENLELYDENLAKHGSKAKNRKDPSFADALKQAQDPALAEEVIRRNSAAQSTSEEDEDDEGDEQEESGIDEDDDVEMKPAESASDHKPPQPKAG
ncbi:hypothetical protein GGH17_002738, partial [Coemansia sp. RSA 788]